MSEKIKVGINGFGRIARIIIRSLEMRETDIEVVAVNLHHADFKRMAYQIEYDSVFGRFMGEVKATDDGITATISIRVAGGKITSDAGGKNTNCDGDEKIATGCLIKK